VEVPSIVQSIHDSGLAEWIRLSLKAMPIIESIHVLTAAVVIGTVFIVDLRLLGLASTNRPVTRVSHDLIRWTWIGFVVSAITGALMFAPNAVTYYGNTAFRLKMLLLIAAGVNMLVFELLSSRSVASWDKATVPPTKARIAGGLSILIWTAVIFVARWIGFTKGYDFSIPDDVDFSF
jgi:hypothetical protein